MASSHFVVVHELLCFFLWLLLFVTITICLIDCLLFTWCISLVKAVLRGMWRIFEWPMNGSFLQSSVVRSPVVLEFWSLLDPTLFCYYHQSLLVWMFFKLLAVFLIHFSNISGLIQQWKAVLCFTRLVYWTCWLRVWPSVILTLSRVTDLQENTCNRRPINAHWQRKVPLLSFWKFYSNVKEMNGQFKKYQHWNYCLEWTFFLFVYRCMYLCLAYTPVYIGSL